MCLICRDNPQMVKFSFILHKIQKNRRYQPFMLEKKKLREFWNCGKNSDNFIMANFRISGSFSCERTFLSVTLLHLEITKFSCLKCNEEEMVF